MTIYGTMITPAHVEQAAMDTLKMWMPDYLAEAERQTGRPATTIPLPAAWLRRNDDVDKWPENNVPAVMLISPGLDGPPTVDGRGIYTAPFALGVGVLVNAATQEDANDLAGIYGICVAMLLCQHPSLGRFAVGLDWTGFRNDPVKANYLPRGAAARLDFIVTVEGVLDASAGPAEPSTDPYDPPGDRPTVATTNLDLNARSLA